MCTSNQQNLRANPALRSRLTVSLGVQFAGMLVVTGCIYMKEPLRLESGEAESPGASHVGWRYKSPVRPCTMQEANEILRWEESYKSIGLGSGVQRFDTVRLASNMPTEDQNAAASGLEDDEIAWLIWGLYDGHAGWETSVALSDHMIPYIVRGLAALSPSGKFSHVAGRWVDLTLKNAFLCLDDEIMDQAAKAVTSPSCLFNDALSQLRPAYAGSCALVSYYHSKSQLLKVACTGDSRAVLGRRNASDGWDTIPLSSDQTGKDPDEVARLERDHPDEPEMLKHDRLLSLAVTRAFGDSRFKWSRELQEQARIRFFGPSIIEPLLSPPYLTAEPVVTTAKIEPGKGDFLIMASHGLWDKITSEQAVDLVGRWLEKNDPSKEAVALNLAIAPATVTQRSSNLQNRRLNMAYTEDSSADETQFVCQDNNAATHLARNALGGSNEDRLCGMLTASPPYSRNLRDDISIQVIFFGNNDPFAIEDGSNGTIQGI